MSKEITTRIRILLLEKGVTQSAIAVRAGVTTAAVNHVVTGYRKNPYLREMIAEACGIPVEELWPEEANRPEDPRCRRCRHKRSPADEDTACRATTC